MRVVIFDGVCNLCNKFVNIIIRRDKKGIFQFSAIGSEYSKSVEEKYEVSLVELDTVVLIENNNFFSKSTAVIKICRHLEFPYNLLVVFNIVPKFIRDKIYDIIARNRYKVFGKKESCMIPKPDVLSRFIP
ncbi:MAG: DUF393 domain-containing protein [Candidatus Moranbacteria bacterium]|nr:DUF393 domain-containing protein [Candidatus Moranbacteria bacterium]